MYELSLNLTRLAEPGFHVIYRRKRVEAVISGVNRGLLAQGCGGWSDSPPTPIPENPCAPQIREEHFDSVGSQTPSYHLCMTPPGAILLVPQLGATPTSIRGKAVSGL